MKTGAGAGHVDSAGVIFSSDIIDPGHKHSKRYAADGTPLAVSTDKVGNTFYGNVDISASATFAASVTAIGANEGELEVAPGTHVGGGVTIPATLSLRVLKGATITVANATTLTINGPFDAGLYQVFSCTGTGKPVFGAGAVKEGYAEWTGAVGDDSTDDTAALTTIGLALDGIAPLILLNKVYKCSTTLSFPALLSVMGTVGAYGKSTLHYTGASDFLTWAAPASPAETRWNIKWSDFNIIGNVAAGKLLTLADGTSNRTFERMLISNGALGLYAKSTTYGTTTLTFNQVHFDSNLVQAEKWELVPDDGSHGFIEMVTHRNCTFRSSGPKTVELLGDLVLPKLITAFVFNNCDASFTTGTMYDLTQVSAITFINGEISLNTTGIKISGDDSVNVGVYGTSNFGNTNWINDTTTNKTVVSADLSEIYRHIGGPLSTDRNYSYQFYDRGNNIRRNLARWLSSADSIVFGDNDNNGNAVSSWEFRVDTAATSLLKLINDGTAYFRATGLELQHIVNKVASANVRASHNAEVNSAALTYVKMKTIALTNGLLGQQRFLFDLKTAGGGATATGVLTRNNTSATYDVGKIIGAEQTDVTGGYVTKSQDITQTWGPGDTVQLWLKTSDVAQAAYAQNFRIAYDDSPTVAVAYTTSTP